MSSLSINPYYCPEDKDILDFIKSVSAAEPELISYLRNRGVYMSKNATRDDLARYIAKEIFTWEDVEELVTLLTLPSKKNHFVYGDHASKADFEILEQAMDIVKTFRSQKYGDRLSVNAIGDDRYKITIEYTDVDYQKTRLIQSIERDAEIILFKTANGFKTRRIDDDRAKEVELAIVGEFERLAKEQNHTVVTSKFLLSQLVSISDKVNFFTHLMEGIDGFDFEEIVSVRIQSVQSPDVELDSEENDEAKNYAASIESLVMNGRNVGATTLYDECVGKDYFPMSATWVVGGGVEDIGKVELKAAFVPELKDHELHFSTNTIWRRNTSGTFSKERPSPMAAARFAEFLRDSASKAMNGIKK